MDRYNPIIKADFPDPDVIRVEDTYYMLSTTMHFRPGAVILRSYDLVHWEIVSHVFDNLDNTLHECMSGERCSYGRGMWAGSLRWHNGKFYVCFSALETDKTYIYTTAEIDGAWERIVLDEYRHHPSLLFDGDRVYMVSGYERILIRELTCDCKAYKTEGLSRTILEKTDEDVYLGYEGAHIQKIKDKYYLFVVFWPKQKPARRTQLCFIGESLEMNFTRYEVLRDDMGYDNQGIAQGGLVETPNGKWYALLCQTRGAAGRIPVLVPVRWEGDIPVFGNGGKVPERIESVSSRPYYHYEPVCTSDEFSYEPGADGKVSLKKQWEFNHVPDGKNWFISEKKGLCIRNAKICTNVTHAMNTLTQRMMWPECAAEVTVDGSSLKNGDVAGLCALQGCYGLIAITKEYGVYYLVVIERSAEQVPVQDTGMDYMPGAVTEKVRLEEALVRIRINARFGEEDAVEFFYQNKNRWRRIGKSHKLLFRMDHFMGCRFGLFNYATKELGGVAEFQEFRYIYSD